MALVSAILIAYNDEVHVANAIRSLREQTLRDLEIICVDDGSQDRTLEIMQQAAAGDPRIQVITQPNGGCFSARHAGVQRATADYVLFLDSDDTFSPQAAETLLEAARETQADVLEYGVELEVDEAELAENPFIKQVYQFLTDYFSHALPPPPETSGGALISACFGERRITWNICNKLYRTSLLREAWRFYQGEYITMLEDAMETLMILSCAKRYARIDTKLYHYRVSGGMSTAPDLLAVPNALKIHGVQAILLRLQKEWLPDPPEDSQAGIAAFRQMVRNSLFYSLFDRCDPAHQEELAGWIRQSLSTEDLCREYLFYILDHNDREKAEDLVTQLCQAMEARRQENDQLTQQLAQAHSDTEKAEAMASQLGQTWRPSGRRTPG